MKPSEIVLLQERVNKDTLNSGKESGNITLMNVLAIDTSTRHLSVAVARRDNLVRYRNLKLRRPLSSSIMPGILNVLKSARVSLEELDGFAVGLGPGSFTSLRVGLATVKGLVFADPKPVVGVSSLDILAMNAPEDGVSICVVCDAKRGLVYSGRFVKNNAGVERIGEYMLTAIEDILKGLKGRVIFLGDGVELFKDKIRKAKSVSAVLLSPEFAVPQARHLLPLAFERFKKGDVANMDTLVPIYLYPEHCQIRP